MKSAQVLLSTSLHLFVYLQKRLPVQPQLLQLLPKVNYGGGSCGICIKHNSRQYDDKKIVPRGILETWAAPSDFRDSEIHLLSSLCLCHVSSRPLTCCPIRLLVSALHSLSLPRPDSCQDVFSGILYLCSMQNAELANKECCQNETCHGNNSTPLPMPATPLPLKNTNVTVQPGPV